ncbi:MAG: hypothetical protein LBN21_04420 [Treponema sp.]|nr:hypothetical protein [Treponema sp.]
MRSGPKDFILRLINTLAGKAGRVLHKPRKALNPLADRLLVDALRMAELPSPAPGEEPRAAFVLERLKNFNLLPAVTDSGSILVRLHSDRSVNEEPVLLFTDLGSKRWHPSDSLARLDADTASGAGLSDSLGPAALLQTAENYSSGIFQGSRDLLLLFTARSLDDPEINFDSILHTPLNRPLAAVGVRGLSLDRLIRPVGSYRLKTTVSTEKSEASNRVTETLIDMARTLMGITWDTEGKTKLFIHHIEAGTVYGPAPAEGILDVEIESSDSGLLDLAMNAVKATAEKIGEASHLKSETVLLSFTPPGNPEKSAGLFDVLRRLTKEMHIKTTEENGADPASFFTADGIPALSLGIALGREGIKRDVIELDSVEKGRRILERLIMEAGAAVKNAG